MVATVTGSVPEWTLRAMVMMTVRAFVSFHIPQLTFTGTELYTPLPGA